jgi:iron complex outermembrane receptor protein
MTARTCARRLARLACTAALGVPAAASADESSSPAPMREIVVTGARAKTPATIATVDAARLRETTALISAEDSLRYLPSLLVRKRHVGDTQSPLATRTSGVGASARSLIYVDGVLLSALIGNNNTTASPRWGMVVPEEIERVDVLYGPYAAAYPGNSIGAVVDISTRLPQSPEATLFAATSVQRFDQYGTRGVYPAYQLAGSAGDKLGALSVFLSANHLASRGQPLAYASVVRPQGLGDDATSLGGAVPTVNRTGAPILVLGASGLERQRQDTLKLKLSLEPSPRIRLTYLGGLFLNDTRADAMTYLEGGTYAGSVPIAGTTLAVPPAAFSNNVYTLDQRHWMHALTAQGETEGVDWRVGGSLYRFANDVQRIPSGALPEARRGGAGSIVRLNGTGWRTLDVSAHVKGGFSAGAHWDEVRLENRRFAAADWLQGAPGRLTQAARGRTRTAAAWVQQVVTLRPRLALTLGARYERWHADRGLNFSLAPSLAVTQPELRRTGFSPKAALRWQPSDEWSATLSLGQAYRFPTVQELYQAVATGPTITVPSPDLRPERARSAEFAVERADEWSKLRLSVFSEAIRDALISQTAPLAPGSGTLFNYVQNIAATRTRGMELAFERKGLLSPRLQLSGSVTLVDPVVRRDPAFRAAEGRDIPQVPRHRTTLVATWHADGAAITVAARYADRSYATIDNSDRVAHTYQGFEGYLVADARVSFAIGKCLEAALGFENITNERYFLFHPFPGRSFTAEMRLRI